MEKLSICDVSPLTAAGEASPHQGTETLKPQVFIDALEDALSDRLECMPIHDSAPFTMDPQLWSNLPNHILEHVLVFLPFWSVLRLQIVSKKWRQYLKSKCFSSKWPMKRSPPDILFIMVTDCWQSKSVAGYNSSLNKWHIISLSHFSPMETSHGFQILASAGSFVCTEDIAWPDRSLIVSNPMNRSYRKLPPMLDMSSPYVVGMIVDSDRLGYRIVVAQDGESLISQYYDSKCDSWQMNVTLNRKVAMLAGMTSVRGLLFCLSFWPLGLIAYNVEATSWEDLQVRMPTSISSPHVVQYNGDLLLIGGLEEYGQLASIRIWKLDLLRKECIEIEEMPDHLFQSFMWTVNGEQFSCIGEGGLICFSNGSMPPMSLMYNMRDQKWGWLPPCPLHEHSPKTHSRNSSSPLGFPIKPCFAMRA